MISSCPRIRVPSVLPPRNSHHLPPSTSSRPFEKTELLTLLRPTILLAHPLAQNLTTISSCCRSLRYYSTTTTDPVSPTTSSAPPPAKTTSAPPSRIPPSRPAISYPPTEQTTQRFLAALLPQHFYSNRLIPPPRRSSTTDSTSSRIVDVARPRSIHEASHLFYCHTANRNPQTQHLQHGWRPPISHPAPRTRRRFRHPRHPQGQVVAMQNVVYSGARRSTACFSRRCWVWANVGVG